MVKRRLVFVVDVERDQDVLSWWKNRENKSAAIWELIRTDLKQQSVMLEDIYRAVTELGQKLAAGQVSVNDPGEPDSNLYEPAGTAARAWPVHYSYWNRGPTGHLV